MKKNIRQHSIEERDRKRIISKKYFDCEKRILNLREQTGISFVTICSTDERYHLYHVRNGYEDFEEDMNTVVQENDMGCHKLYKCVDDIVDDRSEV